MKDTVDNMIYCAEELAEHGINVHRIISKKETFVTRGLLHDVGISCISALGKESITSFDASLAR